MMFKTKWFFSFYIYDARTCHILDEFKENDLFIIFLI